MLRFAFALLALSALGGCSSLTTGGGSATLRPVDPATDDLSALIFAFDVPRGVEPIERTSVLSFDAGPVGSGRHLKLGLVRADAGDLTGMLPPPSTQRAYYLFGFSDADEAKLREAQAWAKGRGVSSALALAPSFCHDAPADPATVSVAILALLPGEMRLAPFESETLADAIQQSGGNFPDCV